MANTDNQIDHNALRDAASKIANRSSQGAPAGQIEGGEDELEVIDFTHAGDAAGSAAGETDLLADTRSRAAPIADEEIDFTPHNDAAKKKPIDEDEHRLAKGKKRKAKDEPDDELEDDDDDDDLDLLAARKLLDDDAAEEAELEDEDDDDDDLDEDLDEDDPKFAHNLKSLKRRKRAMLREVESERAAARSEIEEIKAQLQEEWAPKVQLAQQAELALRNFRAKPVDFARAIGITEADDLLKLSQAFFVAANPDAAPAEWHDIVNKNSQSAQVEQLTAMVNQLAGALYEMQEAPARQQEVEQQRQAYFDGVASQVKPRHKKLSRLKSKDPEVFSEVIEKTARKLARNLSDDDPAPSAAEVLAAAEKALKRQAALAALVDDDDEPRNTGRRKAKTLTNRRTSARSARSAPAPATVEESLENAVELLKRHNNARR